MSKKLAPQSRPVKSSRFTSLRDMEFKALQSALLESALEAELDALAAEISFTTNRQAKLKAERDKAVKERKAHFSGRSRKQARDYFNRAKSATVKRLQEAKANGDHGVLRAIWSDKTGGYVLELVYDV